MRRILLAATFLLCGATAGCGESAPYPYGWFYRFVVELIDEGQPLTIDVVIGCGTQVRHIPGEGRSARAVWGPYIYGVRTKSGHGVLVQSPNVCDREMVKQPAPADFLPLVLWAPDADNLEFLVAYLNERAYEQPVSKLKFVRATITDARQSDYNEWRATKWKDNIVPTSARTVDQMRSYFRSGGDNYLPESADVTSCRRDDAVRAPASCDPRSEVRMECYSYVRMPIPEKYRDRLRAAWPPDHPRYWLFSWPEGNEILSHTHDTMTEAQRRGLWTTEALGLPTFYTGLGIKRRSGTGNLEMRPSWPSSGEALRIPFRIETGYPWAGDRLFTQSTIDIHADTSDGWDQGFGYCYRDLSFHYLQNKLTRKVAPRDYRIIIDDQLVGTTTSPTGEFIAERDEYLWKRLSFPLQYELGAMQ
jgi:hypothetical protein